MKRFILGLLALITIAGCSKSPDTSENNGVIKETPVTQENNSVDKGTSDKVEQRTTCTIDTNFLLYDSTELQIISNKNILSKFIIKGLVGETTPFDKEALDSMVRNPSDFGKSVNRIEGAHKTLERIDDTTYYEIIEFDLEAGDFLDFIETGYLGHAKGYNKYSQINTDEFIAGYKQVGFTCTDQ